MCEENSNIYLYEKRRRERKRMEYAEKEKKNHDRQYVLLYILASTWYLFGLLSAKKNIGK